MRRNKLIGRSLMVTGTVLTMIGVAAMFIKRNPTVLFMSLPIVLLGIIILYNSENNSSAVKSEIKDPGS